MFREKQQETEPKEDHEIRKKQNEKFVDEDEEQDKKHHLELLKVEAKNF